MTTDMTYVNPFIESVQELFSRMLASEAVVENVSTTSDQGGPRNITALIGLGGATRSVVSLAFPTSTVLAITGQLLGMEIETIDETVSDTVGELVNMVAGFAKAKLHQGDGTPVELSLPTVVRGNGYLMDNPKGATCHVISFSSSLGEFSLRVSLQQSTVIP